MQAKKMTLHAWWRRGYPLDPASLPMPAKFTMLSTAIFSAALPQEFQFYIPAQHLRFAGDFGHCSRVHQSIRDRAYVGVIRRRKQASPQAGVIVDRRSPKQRICQFPHQLPRWVQNPKNWLFPAFLHPPSCHRLEPSQAKRQGNSNSEPKQKKRAEERKLSEARTLRLCPLARMLLAWGA
jgi:hypothetical protein